MIWLVIVLVVVVLIALALGRSAPLPDETTYQAAVDLHAIGRRIDLSLFKSELRRDAAALRRELRDELDATEPTKGALDDPGRTAPRVQQPFQLRLPADNTRRSDEMKMIYEKARNRLMTIVVAIAAVPLVFVVVIKVFDGFESVFAAIGLFVFARFGWQWYWGGGW